MSPKGDDDDVDLDAADCSPPAPPHSIEITDFDAQSVKLKWEESPTDGGAPITGYIMEYKEHRGEEWQEGPKVKPAKFLTGEIKELITGTKYEFRVRGVNRSGASDPSDPTLPQVIKAQKAPAKIDRKVMVDEKCVKVNQQMVLEVPVEGAPVPETSWWYGDAQVKATDLIHVNNSMNVAKLLFIPAKRNLQGKYVLKASNKWGSDEAAIEINVYGKPSVPRGPLQVSDVTKRTCLLSWKPPADDGGKAITVYEVEKKDPNVDAWLPVGQTKGTSLEVKNLVEGKTYQFLVRAVNDEGDSPDLVQEDSILARDPFDPPGKPGKPEVPDWGPDFAELRWKAPAEDGGAEISGYRVEMRNRDKRAWVEAAANVKENACRITSGIQLGREYEFRVTASNRGGESELSPASAPVLAKSRFVKPKINRDLLPKEKTVTSSQVLRLEAESEAAEPPAEFIWTFPNGTTVDSDLRVEVETSGNVSLLSMHEVKRSENGQWKVVARNSEGEDEAEIRVVVEAPPSRPNGPLEVADVTPAGCKLAWKKPDDDGGAPITMYTIERRDVEKEAWLDCGKLQGKMVQVLKVLEFDVTGLLEGFVYMFRVCAVNVQGESLPLDSKIPICAKNAKDRPRQPYGLTAVDWDRKWATLQWSSPIETDITHYVVEAQEQFMVPKDDEEEAAAAAPAAEGGEEAAAPAPAAAAPPPPKPQRHVSVQEMTEYCTNWTAVLATSDAATEAKISDLTPDNKYRFRVKAVNSAGPSEPSDPTKDIVCKQRKLWPAIDTSTLKEVRVSRGDTISLFAKVKGEPAPTMSWFYGKIAIKAGPSVEISDKEYSSRLVVRGARRDDTGTYSLRAENYLGEQTALVDVVVMVAPSKPRGPMKIHDVHAEGCTCEWQPPEDDGGSPVTHYIVERMDQGKGGSWMPCGRSDEPRAAVNGLTPSKEYRLHVFAVNAEGESVPLEGVDSFITENPFGPPSAPSKPVLFDGDLDHFELKWEEPKNDGGSRVTGYQLERRPWREAGWARSGEVRGNLTRGISAGDIDVGQSYAVRVRAINAGGEGPWSLDSDKLDCKFKALKPKVNFRGGPKDVTVKAGDTLTIAADVPGEPQVAADDVVWAAGGRSYTAGTANGVSVVTGDYKTKLQIDQVFRRDCGPITCTATNQHGSASASVRVLVTSPPAPPDGMLQVSAVYKNGCKLAWEAAKDDGGLALEYAVEKYISSADAWSNIGRTTKTSFAVKDLECGREYEFRVRSVNALGESEALQTMRSVVAKDNFTVPFPPGPPEVLDWNERQMEIQWTEPLDDGGVPIIGYHVEAKHKGGEGWQLWETVDTATPRATILKLQRGLEYQFRAVAINKAGKSEPSHPSKFKEARSRNLAPYIDVKLLKDVSAVSGDRVKFELPIFGEPAPTVEWAPANTQTPLESVRGSSGMTVADTPTHAKLVFHGIGKAHAGAYTVTIRNASGTDSAKFSIGVLDRPDGPEGPLTMAVEGSECTLLWKKSKDDGGAPIEYYQVERFEEERGTWLAIGKSRDNTFNARGLLDGRAYKFRVCAVNKYGDSDALESKDYLRIGSAAHSVAADGEVGDSRSVS